MLSTNAALYTHFSKTNLEAIHDRFARIYLNKRHHGMAIMAI